MSGPVSAPPGWYGDPDGLGYRWWDGQQWTQHVSQPGPTVHDQLESERRWTTWGKRAFVGYALVGVLELVNIWASSSSFRHEFDAFRTAAQTGRAVPTNDQFGLSTFTALLDIPTILVYVGMLIWQFRAATTARWLGLPARRSPGLGVGSWFIPVVNFWFPYQALRDCLPPGDPGRRVVARLWTCVVSAIVATGVAAVFLVIGSPAAPVFFAVAVAVECGLALFGVRTVGTIFDAHRRLLFPSQPNQLTT